MLPMWPLPSLRGSLLLMQMVGRLSLPKRAGMPRLARHKLRPASIEGALHLDAETLPDHLMRIVSPPQSLVKSNAPGTRSLIGLNSQQLTQTWMMIMTPSLSTLLTRGGVGTYMLGLMLDAHSESNKPNTDPYSEQHQRKSA